MLSKTISVLANVSDVVRSKPVQLFTGPRTRRFGDAKVTTPSYFAFSLTYSKLESTALQDTGSEQEGLTGFATVVSSGTTLTSTYESQFIFGCHVDRLDPY